jgi:hypothetical protein
MYFFRNRQMRGLVTGLFCRDNAILPRMISRRILLVVRKDKLEYLAIRTFPSYVDTPFSES